MNDAAVRAEGAAIDSFIHLTDLHFWEVVRNPLKLMNKRFLGNANVTLRRRHEILTGQSAAFLDYITGIDTPNVILTGDFASTSTDAEFRAAHEFVAALASTGKRAFVIPGNHDVYTFESVRAKRFERYLGEWMPATPLPAMSALPGGTPVVFVPTVCPNFLSSRGRITAAEIERADSCVSSSASPLVVAGHYPLLDRTYGYAMSRERRLRGASGLRQTLGRFGGRLLYVCGHVHRFSHVVDPEYSLVSYLTSGALFRRDHAEGHTGEFSEVRVEAGGFRVLRHRYAGGWRVSEEPARPSEMTDRPAE